MSDAHRIFLSYAHSDAPAVRRIATALEGFARAGIGDWQVWDDDAVRLGEDWVDVLERGMRDSDVYVLVVSPQFLSSEFCMYELGFALKEQRNRAATIIPIAIDETDVRVLPSYLRKFHVIDGRGLQAEQIAERVLERLGNPQAPVPRQHAVA